VTFSFGVIWAVILLAPGLATYSGLFVPSRALAFRPAPPSPNSLTTIGVVIGGALAAHMIWLTWLTYGNPFIVRSGLQLVRFAFDPNVYALTLSLLTSHTAVTVDALAYAMLHATGLTLAAYVAVRLSLRLKRVQSATEGLLYGHLAGLVRDLDERAGFVVIAFVLTKVGDGPARVGYEGLVEKLSFGSDRVIAAITLSGASKFVMRFGYSGFARVPGQMPSDTIDRLLIEQAQIENIAFNIYEPAPLPAST